MTDITVAPHLAKLPPQIYPELYKYGLSTSFFATCRTATAIGTTHFQQLGGQIQASSAQLRRLMTRIGNVQLLTGFENGLNAENIASKTSIFVQSLFPGRPKETISIEEVQAHLQAQAHRPLNDIKIVWKAIATALLLDPNAPITFDIGLEREVRDSNFSEAIVRHRDEGEPPVQPTTVTIDELADENASEHFDMWMQMLNRRIPIFTPVIGPRASSVTELTISDPELEYLPESLRHLIGLARLDLTGCSNLKRLPECLGHLPVLNHIVLKDCVSLRALHESIGTSGVLNSIDASGCTSLRTLPDSLSQVIMLSYLNVSGCRSLLNLGNGLHMQKDLSYINLSGCILLRGVPEIQGKQFALSYVNMSGCATLRTIPATLWATLKDAEIDLSDCIMLEEIPNLLGRRQNAKTINLSGCVRLRELTMDAHSCHYLERLDLTGCVSLPALPAIFYRLAEEDLDLSGFTALQELPDSEYTMQRTQRINLSGLVHIETIPSAVARRELDVTGCLSLRQYKKFDSYSIDTATLLKCNLHETQDNPTKTDFGVEVLDLTGYRNFTELTDDWDKLTNISVLNLSGWNNNLLLSRSITNLNTLQHLNLSGWTSLFDLPSDLHKLTNLRTLDLTNCTAIISLPDCIYAMINERGLDVIGADHLLDASRILTPDVDVEQKETEDTIETFANAFISAANAFRLAVTSPKSDLFTKVDPASLPETLRSEIGRVILCWVLRIFTLGFIELAKHFLPERVIEYRGQAVTTE